MERRKVQDVKEAQEVGGEEKEGQGSDAEEGKLGWKKGS